MLRIPLFVFAVIFSLPALGQNPVGDWYGSLSIKGVTLPIVFHVAKTESGFSSKMDSPEQKAFDIPVGKTSYFQDTLLMILPSMKIVYKGMVKDDKIEGVFRQAGQEFPMLLTDKKPEPTTYERPQEPTGKLPYQSEEVTFTNKAAGVQLSGALTLPAGKPPYPAVILVSGSGPQDRNSELLHHKPFLILSDYLTRNGIAVLRYDDRGVGQSKGLFRTATTADFAEDATAAIAYLSSRKEVDQKKVGIIGHSEGGLIAPMVAAAHPEQVKFIVLLAGPGLRGDKVLLKQQALLAKVQGASDIDIAASQISNGEAFELVQQIMDTDSLTAALKRVVSKVYEANSPGGENNSIAVAQQVNGIVTPWTLYFLRYDPALTLQLVKCPVLALNGSNDLQVSAKENLAAIAKNLKIGGNKKVTTQELEGLNHLMQESETGDPADYEKITQTISPLVLTEILSWVKELE